MGGCACFLKEDNCTHYQITKQKEKVCVGGGSEMLEFNYRQVVFKLHKEERMPWTRYITQTTILSFYLCSLLSNKPKNFTNFRMTCESAAICSKNKVDEVKVSSSIKAFEANNFHSILWLLTIYSTLVNTGPTTYNNFLVSCEQYVRSRAQIEILEMNHLFVWGPQAFGRTAHLGGGNKESVSSYYYR